MHRGVRPVLGMIAVLAALSTGRAEAQYGGYNSGYWGWRGWGGGGGGSTVQGDVARGMGVYAMGAGQYNLNTAQATSIDADTMMRWNSYMWTMQNNINREHYARMAKKKADLDKAVGEIQTRLNENPTNADIEHGDALNALLTQLSDPRIHPSALRMAKVPLNKDWIKDIPFRYASEAVTLSLHRLTSPDNWPTALRGSRFEAERQDYQKAIDAALEQDKEGDLTPETIKAVQGAVTALRQKAEATIPRTSRDYITAENYLKSLRGMAEMLESPSVDEVLATLEKADTTTVAGLLGFMQMYNLRFGSATTPRERKLYHDLYPLLDRERDQVMGQVASKINVEAPPPAPPAPEATAIFHKMPWEHLNDKDREPPAAK